jgi:sulfur carrier protein ThiS
VRVHVTLKGTLAERLPGGHGEVELPEGSTAAALAQALDLPGRRCVVVVNGAAVGPDATLAEGDRVQVFPPMAGG